MHMVEGEAQRNAFLFIQVCNALDTEIEKGYIATALDNLCSSSNQWSMSARPPTEQP